jgi:hypothetical protein
MMATTTTTEDDNYSLEVQTRAILGRLQTDLTAISYTGYLSEVIK